MRAWVACVVCFLSCGAAQAGWLVCRDPSAPFTNFEAVFAFGDGTPVVALTPPPDGGGPSRPLNAACVAGGNPGKLSLRCDVFNPLGGDYAVDLDGDIAGVAQDGRDLALLLCE